MSFCVSTMVVTQMVFEIVMERKVAAFVILGIANVIQHNRLITIINDVSAIVDYLLPIYCIC